MRKKQGTPVQKRLRVNEKVVKDDTDMDEEKDDAVDVSPIKERQHR